MSSVNRPLGIVWVTAKKTYYRVEDERRVDVDLLRTK